MKTTATILFFTVLLAASASSGFNREPTPEALAWLQEVEAYKQSFRNLDPYQREALALNPEAGFGDRYEAIQLLAEDPTAHLHALEALMNEPQLSLRFAAIEILEPVRPDVAYQSLIQLFDQLVQPSEERKSTDAVRATRAAALLARMGDGSKFPHVANQLLQSSRRMDMDSAISALSSFYYMKGLNPYKPLVAFVDKTLPDLASANDSSRGKIQRLVSYALYTLAGLHAVEAIPDFVRWQTDPRIEPVRDAVEFNLRRLREMKAALDRGEPDPRDAIKIIPGTAPAWKLPTGVRD
jgi:hypothetical protein